MKVGGRAFGSGEGGVRSVQQRTRYGHDGGGPTRQRRRRQRVADKQSLLSPGPGPRALPARARPQQPKVRSTAWGSSYRAAPEILHGYDKVRGGSGEAAGRPFVQRGQGPKHRRDWPAGCT
jgi:hypothetical protein